jgi:two-component system heavy metal sensor histidine kinase CusS
VIRAQTDSQRRPHGTLRQRVVASFVVVIGLSLLGVGTYVYFQTEHRLLQEVDSGLHAAASQALLSLQEEDGRLIISGDGPAVSRPGAEAGFSLRVLTPDGVQSDGAGQMLVGLPTPPVPGYMTVDASGESWRVLTEAVPSSTGPSPGWVQVARPLSPTEDLLQTLRTQLYLVLPIALVLAAIAAYLLAGRTLRPLAAISLVAESIRAGDFGRRIRYRGPADEIGGLAVAFDRMLDRVEQAFARERRFASEASHELRTPLTAIKGGIGVTRSRTRTVTEYQAALEDLEDQVDRLIRLSTNLLVLARAGRARTEEPELIDISDLLTVTVQQLGPLAVEKGIELKTEVPPALYVGGFAEDLARVFSNLLSNAIKFTPRAGHVRVAARRFSGAREDSIRVYVADDGAGIAPEDLPHIFEPFYKGKEALLPEEESSGLGLAIAQDIVVAHGGTLDADSRQGEGSTFMVSLPGPRPPQPEGGTRARKGRRR